MGLGTKLLSDLLKTVLGTINRVPSFMSDFDIVNQEATIDNGIYISNRVVKGKIGDKDASFNVAIAATNVDSVPTISTAIKGIDRAGQLNAYNYNYEGIGDALELLVGNIPTDQIWSSNAQDGTLLNPKLDENTTELPNWWKDIALDLKYDLKCYASNAPQGKVTGVTLKELQNWISVYPSKCGFTDKSDFEINPVFLVLPILILIQNSLKEQLDSMSKVIYGKENPNSNSEDSNAMEDAVSDAVNNQQNQEQTSTGTPSTMTTTENGGKPVEHSKKINIKLQKIAGSTDIDLMAITANFNPGEALNAVDDVLASPDFIDLITETPQSYEVCIDDEGYDVNPCTDLIVDPNANLTQLFIQANQFSRNLHMIHWLSIGNDMEKLHIKAEELYGELDQEIDLLAELIVEKTGTIIDINTIETWNTVGTQDRTFQQGIECIKQYAQSFIDYIDITYPNQPSDVQSVLDDWLRYWNKQLNYFIKREQEI